MKFYGVLTLALLVACGGAPVSEDTTPVREAVQAAAPVRSVYAPHDSVTLVRFDLAGARATNAGQRVMNFALAALREDEPDAAAFLGRIGADADRIEVGLPADLEAQYIHISGNLDLDGIAADVAQVDSSQNYTVRDVQGHRTLSAGPTEPVQAAQLGTVILLEASAGHFLFGPHENVTAALADVREPALLSDPAFAAAREFVSGTHTLTVISAGAPLAEKISDGPISLDGAETVAAFADLSDSLSVSAQLEYPTQDAASASATQFSALRDQLAGNPMMAVFSLAPILNGIQISAEGEFTRANANVSAEDLNRLLDILENLGVEGAGQLSNAQAQ